MTRGNLVTERERLGYSIGEMARECGMTYRTYRWTEEGRYEPDEGQLGRIADVVQLWPGGGGSYLQEDMQWLMEVSW